MQKTLFQQALDQGHALVIYPEVLTDILKCSYEEACKNMLTYLENLQKNADFVLLSSHDNEGVGIVYQLVKKGFLINFINNPA